MIYIFVSRKHDYSEQVKRVLSLRNLPGKRIYIEDMLRSQDYFNEIMRELSESLDHNVIYFLCNNLEIPRIIDSIKDSAHCINKKFYTRNWDKEQMFSVLQGFNTSLKIPFHYCEIVDIIENDFPIYVKSIMHQGITFKAENRDIIKGFSYGIEIDDYYFEENVASNKTKEIKIFYLNGTIMPADSNIEDYKECLKYNSELENSLRKIANYFKLDCCSFDVIFSKDAQYLIDVNSAPAYYSTMRGTELFAEYFNSFVKG